MNQDELLGWGLGMVLPNLGLPLRLSKPATHPPSFSPVSSCRGELEAKKRNITGWNKKKCIGNINEIRKQTVTGTMLITKVYKGERVIHMQNGHHRAWPNPAQPQSHFPAHSPLLKPVLPKHSHCHSHWPEETPSPGKTPLSPPWQRCDVV